MSAAATSRFGTRCQQLARVNFDDTRHYHLVFGKHEFCILRHAPIPVLMRSREVVIYPGGIQSIRLVSNSHV